MKIYCSVCNEHRKTKNPKMPYFFKKTLDLYIICSKSGHNYKKISKEEESIELLKIVGLIANIEEYQKLYNHVWRKHMSRI